MSGTDLSRIFLCGRGPESYRTLINSIFIINVYSSLSLLYSVNLVFCLFYVFIKSNTPQPPIKKSKKNFVNVSCHLGTCFHLIFTCFTCFHVFPHLILFLLPFLCVHRHFHPLYTKGDPKERY